MFMLVDPEDVGHGQRWKWLAYTRVIRAIKRGILQRPSELKCVDCGKNAVCYDHRDYGRPLDVVPVCHGCNLRRGPGMIREPEKIASNKKIEQLTDSQARRRAWAREGGLIGGPRRALALSPQERHDIASKAAKARWNAIRR